MSPASLWSQKVTQQNVISESSVISAESHTTVLPERRQETRDGREPEFGSTATAPRPGPPASHSGALPLLRLRERSARTPHPGPVGP